jgi:hypothetical protein
MMRLFAVLAAVVLTTSACATANISEITKHLNERKCATDGSITVGGMVPPAGYVKWKCGEIEE